MTEIEVFLDNQIAMLSLRLRGYLYGGLTDTEMAEAAWSVVDAWIALPNEVRSSEPVAHEDVLWHAVWTAQHLSDEEHRREGISNPALHECLRLLESRGPLPSHYAAYRP